MFRRNRCPCTYFSWNVSFHFLAVGVMMEGHRIASVPITFMNMLSYICIWHPMAFGLYSFFGECNVLQCCTGVTVERLRHCVKSTQIFHSADNGDISLVFTRKPQGNAKFSTWWILCVFQTFFPWETARKFLHFPQCHAVMLSYLQ